MLPKHQNPANAQLTASAPYNFVPLPERVVTVVSRDEIQFALEQGETREEKIARVQSLLDARLPDHDVYNSLRHSGWFEVKLTTQSPLYIRAPLTLEEFKRQEAKQYIDGTPIPEEGTPEYRRLVKNKPEFFYTRNNQTPVIPGSSLRGMLRSLLEIVSYSKFNGVADSQLIYRAVGDKSSLGAWYRQQMLGENQAQLPEFDFDYPLANLRGGYLRRHNGDWAIQPALEWQGESFVHVDYEKAESIVGTPYGKQKTYDVFVVPAVRTNSNRGRRNGRTLSLSLALTPASVHPRTAGAPTPPGMQPAVLVESGHMGSPAGRPPRPHQKHMHCAIYLENDSVGPIPIPREMWETYEQDRDMNRGSGVTTRKLNAEGQPLFYLLDDDGKLVFFGPTMMFRLPYKRTVWDLIPTYLRDADDIDFTETIFGFTRTRREIEQMQTRELQIPKTRAYAGRVFLSDAKLEPANQSGLWLDNSPITPKILATPKPTTFQHYLVQAKQGRDELSHYDSPTRDAEERLRGAEPVIRGQKMYWHQGNIGVSEIREDDPTWTVQGQVKARSTQHTRMRPLNPNKTFCFEVHFENLTAEEVGALCWVLHPRGNAGKTYSHHLGMGKPYGMGAVSLNAKLNLIDRAARYDSLLNGEMWSKGLKMQDLEVTSTEVQQKFVQPFEKRVLDALLPKPSCQRLADLERIQMLLKLMEWPGFKAVPPARVEPENPPELPSSQQNRKLENHPNTRYMKIGLRDVQDPAERNEYRGRPVLPDPRAFGEWSDKSKPFEVDDVFEGAIEDVTEDEVVVLVDGYEPTRLYGIVDRSSYPRWQPREMERVKCQIKKIVQGDEGNVVFECDLM